MIPFFDQPVLALGPLTIHAYGALVATGVIFGGWLVLRRARRMGLDAVETERLLTWMLVAGFLGAHLFSVFAYFPDKLARDPLLLFRIWEDLSSFGGIAGGAVGIWLYLRYRAPESVRLERWAYWDLIGFGLPFGWAFGRLGCTMAHDHPGKVTDFFLARSLESPEARAYITRLYEASARFSDLPPARALADMGFHDLGWYEFLYLALVMVPVFLLLDRTERTPGFWAAAFLLMYGPVRFMLDYLRVVDPRYLGLTPGQYMAAAGTLIGIWIWRSQVAPAREGGVGSG